VKNIFLFFSNIDAIPIHTSINAQKNSRNNFNSRHNSDVFSNWIFTQMTQNTEEVTIEKLRKSGYKVRVLQNLISPDDVYAHLAGRITRIEILDPNGKEWFGESRCSYKDNYNRKLGNKIALQRAIKKMWAWHFSYII